MKSNDKYDVGERVMWDSQARGSWVSKRGTVVAVLKAGQVPTYKPARISFRRRMYDGVMPRDHESYLVLADRKGKNGTLLGDLYWPRASVLRRES